MRARLEAALNKRWYGGVQPGWLLRCVSIFYALLMHFRTGFYRSGLLKSKKISVPVIVVGNFTVGGTGKTPFTIALVQAMLARGWKPGIVSRGYGRTNKNPVTVKADTLAEDCGDEPLLIFQRTQCAIRVDSQRVRAAEYLLAEGCNLIIADDGLQHLALQRDIEIELIDHERKYGNGFVLPSGPLRENPRICDFKIANGALEDDVALSQYGMQLAYGDAEHLGNHQTKALSDFSSNKVTAVAGIGNPERFFNALMARGLNINPIAFADHHVFLQNDLPENETILMTEKDAVKCRQLNLKDAWSVPVNAVLNQTLFDAVQQKLKAL